MNAIFSIIVMVFGQSLGISDVKSYILLKPIMTGSDSEKFHLSLVQKSATKAREDWVSSQGWLFNTWRLDDDMHKSRAHVPTLAQSMHLAFFSISKQIFIRLSAHNCQLISTLCRSTSHHIKHHQPNRAQKHHSRPLSPQS